MQYTRNYDFTQGTEIVADQVDLELNSIASVLNAGIEASNIVDGSVTNDKMATNINPETRLTEMFVDGVYTGLTLSPTSAWSNLNGTIISGVSYIRGRRVSTSEQSNHAFTASKDTYVDLDKNNNFTYIEQTLGAAEPAVTANSVRLMKVVTGAAAISAWYDRRPWQWITVGEAGGPPFENSWVWYSNDNIFNKPAFYKDALGIVRLRGMSKNGTINANIFTLPIGYRPLKQYLIAVQTNVNTIGRLDVMASGWVLPVVGSNGWFSIDNVSFKAEQ